MGYFNFENFPSEKTPISAENLLAMQQGLMELVFPIGSTYITQSNTNPNTILNFGTWERLKGKVCLGLDENDNDLKTIGNTGGEKTHTLSTSEMPSHAHYSLIHQSGSEAQGYGLPVGGAFMNRVMVEGMTLDTSTTGGSQAHNNMPPYEVVGYMWIRRS